MLHAKNGLQDFAINLIKRNCPPDCLVDETGKEYDLYDDSQKQKVFDKWAQWSKDHPEPVILPEPVKVIFPDNYEKNNKVFLDMAKEQVESEKEFHWLLLGITGSGKTTISCIYLDAAKRYSKFDKDRKPLVVDCADSYLAYSNAKDDVNRTSSYYHTESNFKTDLVLIDDIGKEQETPASSKFYEHMLEKHCDAIEKKWIKCSVITSNLTPKQIRERYGDRAMSRIRKMFKVVVLKEHDFRMDHADEIMYCDEM